MIPMTRPNIKMDVWFMLEKMRVKTSPTPLWRAIDETFLADVFLKLISVIDIIKMEYSKGNPLKKYT